jgi:ubiquitin-protein ligase
MQAEAEEIKESLVNFDNSSKIKHKRFLKEIEEFNDNPVPYVKLTGHTENTWSLVIEDPYIQSQSIHLKFPSNYPFSAPKISLGEHPLANKERVMEVPL